MTNEEAKKLFLSKKYRIYNIKVSLGIDALSNKFSQLIVDTESKNLLFFENRNIPNLVALLPLDKVNKVIFAGPGSEHARRGSQPGQKNILITYESNGEEKEILFGNSDFPDPFPDLYEKLLPYAKEGQIKNDEGFVSL